MWKEKYVDWTNQRVLFVAVASRSKVIVTTRNQGVASIMGTIPAYELKKLVNDNYLLYLVNIPRGPGRLSIGGNASWNGNMCLNALLFCRWRKHWVWVTSVKVNDKGLKNNKSLEIIEILDCLNVKVLPDDLHITDHLHQSKCPNLVYLAGLPRQKLTKPLIVRCNKLKARPNWMHNLASLKKLTKHTRSSKRKICPITSGTRDWSGYGFSFRTNLVDLVLIMRRFISHCWTGDPIDSLLLDNSSLLEGGFSGCGVISAGRYMRNGAFSHYKGSVDYEMIFEHLASISDWKACQQVWWSQEARRLHKR